MVAVEGQLLHLLVVPVEAKVNLAIWSASQLLANLVVIAVEPLHIVSLGTEI